jgi:hypothetical protein
MLLVGRLWADEAARGAKCRQRGAIRLAALLRGLEREMQHAARRFDRRERARMHLAEHGRAQRMRGEPLAPDCDIDAHGPDLGASRGMGRRV